MVMSMLTPSVPLRLLTSYIIFLFLFVFALIFEYFLSLFLDLESHPLLPQSESVKTQPFATTTKLGVVALILAAASAVSYYSQSPSIADTSLDVTSTDDASSSSSTSTTMPHVLFVFVDDMGMNDIGYKSSDLTYMTPELNKLASAGIILEKYYTMQLCTPARSALLTAKLPMKLGMQYEVWFTYALFIGKHCKTIHFFFSFFLSLGYRIFIQICHGDFHCLNLSCLNI